MVKNYFFVFILALIVGLFNIFPSLLIWGYLDHSGGEFLLMQQSGYRDEFFQYLPRAREVFDGHWPPRNIFSGVNGPSPLNPLPSALFSPFLFLFNGNLNWAYLSAQFVFAVIIFLLFFWLGWAMVRSKLWAVFFALVGVLTQIPQLIFRYYDRNFLDIIFKKFIPIVRTPIDKMYFARVDDPMLTYPILLAAIISFYFFWAKPGKITAPAAGVLAGLLAYTYLHYWLFWTIFLAVFFLWNLFSKKMDKTRLKNYLILGLIFFLTLIPYIINYFNFSQTDYARDYSFRLGKENSRFLIIDYIKAAEGEVFVLNYIVYSVILTGVYLLYFKKRVNPDKGLIFVCLIIAMFLVWHTPLFLGFGFALSHFNKPINLAVYIILFNMAHDFIRTHGWFRPPLVRTALLLLVALLISKQVVNVLVFENPPIEFVRKYDFPNDIVSSWQWFNANINGEPVVVSPSLITSLYLASYTSSRPYLATGFLSPLTDWAIEDRFLTSGKLFQISDEVLTRRLDVYFRVDCSNGLCPKDGLINFEKTPWYLLSASYGASDFYKEPKKVIEHYSGLTPTWSQTSSDFVYYGPWEKQFSSVDFYKDTKLELAYKNALVEIFKIKGDTL